MLFGKIECRIAEKFVILLARNNFCVKLFRKLFCIAYVIVVTVCKNYIFKLSAVFLNFRIKFFIRCTRIGYFINSFIPFKAGDLVRAWISGRKMKNGRGFALATVIVDRYLDILVVGILFAIFSAFNLDSADSVWFYISVCAP